MNDWKYYEQISAYLENQLPEKERVEFESKLKANAELQKEFEALESAHLAIGFMSETAVREKVKKVAAQSNQTGKIVRHFPKYSIAATIAFLIVGFLVFNQLNYSNEALAMQYFEKESLPAIRGSENSNIEEDENSGLFKEGIANFENGNPVAAADIFQRIIDSGDARFFEKAHWQLALSLVRSGDITKAQTALQKIKDYSDFSLSTRVKAGKLTKELNSFQRHFIF